MDSNQENNGEEQSSFGIQNQDGQLGAPVNSDHNMASAASANSQETLNISVPNISADERSIESPAPGQSSNQPIEALQPLAPESYGDPITVQSGANEMLPEPQQSDIGTQLEQHEYDKSVASSSLPQDYLAQAQSTISAVSGVDPRKTALYGGAALLGVIAIGIIALFLLRPVGSKQETSSVVSTDRQKHTVGDTKNIEDLTVKIPASWRVVEDKAIGARVRLPEQDQFNTDGSSESEMDDVKLITSAYGVANSDGESSMSISLIRAEGLKDEKQLDKLVQSTSGPASPASLLYKDIKSNLTKKSVNKQTM